MSAPGFLSPPRLARGGPAAVLALVIPALAFANAGPQDFADLADRLVPSVVNIASSQEAQAGGAPQMPPGSPFEEFFRDYFERRGEERPEQRRPMPRANSLGSGFVVDSEGHIVTNNHVIAEASEITVTFANGESLPASVIGRDPKTDIALLKVDPPAPLDAATWGDSDSARVGNWVLAIGNPFGLGNTVTAGIISARARDINAGPFDDFIQTDAPINRGNSGGPLFDMRGEVIGINTAIYSPTGGSVGIGFSVPANLARNVVRQLRQFGETRRGWLGVRIQTVTEDLAESLGLDDASGALVASVSSDSPAAAAGVEVGDVILEFDGKAVETMRRLPRIVAETEIGKEVEVVLWRDGGRVSLGVMVGRLDEGEVRTAAAIAEPPEVEDEPPVREVPALGLTLSMLTDEVRTEFEVGDETDGVMVIDVDAASAAAEKGLRPGDIIVEVGQEQVSTPAEVASKIESHQQQDKNTVLLLLDRSGDLQFVAVRLLAG